MRMLAYGAAVDLHDEYLRMSAQLFRKSLIKFVEGVISNFGDEYLQKPNEEELARLLHIGEQRGFPGMLGSIDCMHWEWKNCPTSWAGQYAGRSGSPTIILEAVASQDLWIWHAFIGTPGSRNDINVLDQSPVFDDILEGPQTMRHKLFARHQESARKDVERAFGVLQAHFAFIKCPCLIWDRDIMGTIMIACIILHNMIVEDERSTYSNYCDPAEFIQDRFGQSSRENEDGDANNDFIYSMNRIVSLASYMKNKAQLQNREAHKALRDDLVEHIWAKFGNCN
ncbi:uncharacterized protein LOC125215218 [Salvia hispanica]|uniref:uncharacterized protein LOC125215218 n=1 Tax=Salvia hispanica TaxID=49212 RepID=UPI0020092194|nr:uncharacterized protein LOC125215218 [Salvia hispanica]